MKEWKEGEVEGEVEVEGDLALLSMRSSQPLPEMPRRLWIGMMSGGPDKEEEEGE